MRRFGAVDLNQSDIRDAARKAGASWLNLSAVGGGCPDALVGSHGQSWLVEVKREKGTLTPDQVEFMSSWRGSKVHVIRTVDEMLKLIHG